jgi:hypothetical protein
LNTTYFTDRDLGIRFPAILAEAGLDVRRHQDHFSDNCPDERWLKEIGRRRWVAITRDKRIRYKPNELEAVIRHRVRLLVIVGKAKFPELADSFVRTLPRIESFLQRHNPPFIAKVYRPTDSELKKDPLHPGRVELHYPR